MRGCGAPERYSDKQAKCTAKKQMTFISTISGRSIGNLLTLGEKACRVLR